MKNTGTAGTPPAPTPAPVNPLLSKGLGARVPAVPVFSSLYSGRGEAHLRQSLWTMKWSVAVVHDKALDRADVSADPVPMSVPVFSPHIREGAPTFHIAISAQTD